MIIKKQISLSALFGCIMLISTTLMADFLDDYLFEEDLHSERHFIDTMDNDPIASEIISENGYLQELAVLKSQTIDPAIIVDILEAFGVINLLMQDFFLRTNPFVKRSILDSTLMDRIPYHQEDCWKFGSFIFYNRTPNCNFTKSSTRMCSYLALAEESIIQAIEMGLHNADLVKFDPRVIFNIVQDMRAEERNIGFLLYFIRQWEKCQLRIYAPLLYHERNFFLTDQQLEDIQAELNLSGDTEFKEKHAISDRFGLGDTRIEAAFTVCEKPTISCYAGPQFTIPTAFTMFSGWQGNTFAKPSTYPDVPFNVIWEALIAAIEQTLTRIQKLRVAAIIEEFFVGAMDRLAANLLDDGLGNHGHLGLGAFIYTDMPLYQFSYRNWAQTGSWINRISLEFLLPNSEKRFFINKHDQDTFDSYDFSNPDDGAENLAFIQQEIVNKFYLIAFDTYVQPKPIFRWTSMINHGGGPCKLYYGTNLWVQGAEHLSSIKGPLDIVAGLDKSKAIAPAAYQFKVLGGLSYTFKEENTTWTIGVDGDYTVLKSGIGRDYMLALRVDASF